MSGKYILVDGQTPVEVSDLRVWAKWFETANRVVRRDDNVIDGVDVSTVFLGLDHARFGHGVPLLFETMIFRKGDGEDTWRYGTYDEALLGHAAAVAQVKIEGR